MSIGDTAKKLGEMWNSSSAEEKQPYERKAAKLKEKYDKVGGRTSEATRVPALESKSTLVLAQDIVAYRTKGKVESESAAAADDDEDEEEEEEEGEDEDDDDDDDD